MLSVFLAIAAASVTPCDRLAAHPSDPDAIVAGVPRDEIDVDAAIEACRAAVEEDPESGRLNYQLARVLTYDGRLQEAAPYMQAAVEANYPQACSSPVTFR